MVTTKQKATVNMQKINRKEYKHIIKESHQTIKGEQGEKKRKEQRGITKTARNQLTKCQ